MELSFSLVAHLPSYLGHYHSSVNRTRKWNSCSPFSEFLRKITEDLHHESSAYANAVHGVTDEPTDDLLPVFLIPDARADADA
jgi:hypothetical protein